VSEPTAPTFAESYYSWALEQWESELQQDMSRLRGIRSGATEKAVMTLETFPIDERRGVVTAMTKRFHPAACLSLNVSLTAREADLLAAYDATRRQVFRASVARSNAKARRAMRLHLHEKLRFLGAYTNLEGSGEWIHTLVCPPWTVETRVEALNRFGEASLCHRVIASGGAVVSDFVSYTAALGIASMTSWSADSEVEVDEVSSAMASLSAWFLDQVLVLLASAGRRPMEKA
jgi:hypothetical protein